jgi:hypothetical protein
MKMTNNSVTQNDTTATPPAGTASPYAAAAATIQQALDTIAAAIPPTPLRQQDSVKFIRQRQSVKPALMDKAANAAEASQLLQGLIDVPETRDTLDFSDTFLPLFEQMDRIAQNLKLAIDARHAKSGTAALNVYSAAKRISQQGYGGAELAVHVANMKPLVKRGTGKKKVTKATTPAAPSAPSTPSAPTASSVPSESAPAK